MKHRTDGGRLPDRLSNPADQALVVKFLESIDVSTAPSVTLEVRREGDQVIVAFDSIAGLPYAVEAKDTITDAWASVGSTVIGTGQRLEVSVAIDRTTRFLRVVQGL